MYRSDAMRSKMATAASGHPTKMTVESVDPEEGFLLSGSGSCFLVGRGDGGIGCRCCRLSVRSISRYGFGVADCRVAGKWMGSGHCHFRCRHHACGYFILMNK